VQAKLDKEGEIRAAKLQATSAQNDLEEHEKELSQVRVELRKHERVSLIKDVQTIMIQIGGSRTQLHLASLYDVLELQLLAKTRTRNVRMHTAWVQDISRANAQAHRKHLGTFATPSVDFN